MDEEEDDDKLTEELVQYEEDFEGEENEDEEEGIENETETGLGVTGKGTGFGGGRIAFDHEGLQGKASEFKGSKPMGSNPLRGSVTESFSFFPFRFELPILVPI